VVTNTSTRSSANTETLQSESPSCQRIHVSRRRAPSTNHSGGAGAFPGARAD
jgi:hypothetical protein